MTGYSLGRRPLLGFGAALGLAAPALAQPAASSRPVTLVVPFPPGGSTDVMARLLAERMAPMLGQPVLVENRPGGATVVGAEYVARAAPDGHTALVNSGTTLTLNPLLMRNLPYKPEDFAAASLLSVLPFAFLVQNRLPATVPGIRGVGQGAAGATQLRHQRSLQLQQHRRGAGGGCARHPHAGRDLSRRRRPAQRLPRRHAGPAGGGRRQRHPAAPQRAGPHHRLDRRAAHALHA
ncbi:hypothetical protein KSF81_17225 [Siccirubricoccus sp. G192]|nr:hypothetical protein [Siccirubricoccus sp. G192]